MKNKKNESKSKIFIHSSSHVQTNERGYNMERKTILGIFAITMVAVFGVSMVAAHGFGDFGFAQSLTDEEKTEMQEQQQDDMVLFCCQNAADNFGHGQFAVAFEPAGCHGFDTLD